jgi:uncharacterized membrane-anchored protein
MIVKGPTAGILMLVFCWQTFAQDTAPEISKEEQYQIWSTKMRESMSPQTGQISLADDVATLNVTETFLLSKSTRLKESLRRNLGNPLGAADSLLGMLFPAAMTPFDGQSWGVTIEYEQDGYVNDDDAADLDYAQKRRTST